MEGSGSLLEGCWRVLKASWGGFSTYFGIFFKKASCLGFCSCWKSFLEGSGRLLGRFLEGFEGLLRRCVVIFGIFFSYSFRNGFLYAFEMILDGF